MTHNPKSMADRIMLMVICFVLGFALLGLLSCAAAPPGMRYANPNCIFRCNVVVVDATGAPMLSTLTATQTGTGGAVTRGITTTETDTRTETTN